MLISITTTLRQIQSRKDKYNHTQRQIPTYKDKYHHTTTNTIAQRQIQSYKDTSRKHTGQLIAGYQSHTLPVVLQESKDTSRGGRAAEVGEGETCRDAH